MKLYTHPASTFARRIKLAALEKGLVLEEVLVDMQKGAHKGPEHIRLNPYGKVPVLVDDDFTLWESTAILEYLEGKHPTPALAPTDPRGRALVQMHMKMCDLYFTTPAGRVAFPRRFMAKERWDAEDQAKQVALMTKHLEILEGWLDGKQYLVGDRYTLADLCYVPWFDFFGLMDLTPGSNVGGWINRCQLRDSSKQTRMER